MKNSDNARYKQKAGVRLRQCWGECTGEVIIEAALIMLAATLFLAIKYALGGFGVLSAVVEAVYIIAAYAAYVPLRYGAAWFYIQQAQDSSIPASGFFSCYMHRRHIKGCLSLELAVLARTVPATAVPIAYIALSAYLGYRLICKSETAAAVFLSCAVVLGTVIVYMYILTVMKYAFVPFLYAFCHDLSPKETIARSEALMKGNRTGVIQLGFSMLPLWASCIAIFPIFFVVPYAKMTFANAAAEIFYKEGPTLRGAPTNSNAEGIFHFE